MDEIFENRASNGVNAKSITSHGRAKQQSCVIDPQAATHFTFAQCGILDMSSEFEDSVQERWIKIVREELSFKPNLLRKDDITHGSRAAVKFKFKTPLLRKNRLFLW